MLHVAVVEDEKEYRETLGEMLDRYAGEHGLKIKVSAFADGSELVADYGKYDILLLDIEMPKLDGMSAAEKIRRMDEDVVIVFITNMAQYAIRGYAVDALDFILKPVNYYTFCMRFDRAVERVKNRGGRKVCLNLPAGVKWIDSRDIFYVEIQNRLIHYHTAEGEFVVRGTLKEVQEELEDTGFAKCNQCYLVNLRHVSEIKKNIVCIAGSSLEISRRNRNAFLTAVTDYLGT